MLAVREKHLKLHFHRLTRLRNDLCCVGWGVKLYSIQIHRLTMSAWSVKVSGRKPWNLSERLFFHDFFLLYEYHTLDQCISPVWIRVIQNGRSIILHSAAFLNYVRRGNTFSECSSEKLHSRRSIIPFNHWLYCMYSVTIVVYFVLVPLYSSAAGGMAVREVTERR